MEPFSIRPVYRNSDYIGSDDLNTFTVEADRAEELLAVLSGATDDSMRHLPDFISANLHLSEDRRHVANYAQWRSQANLDAMMRNQAAQPHMREAAAIATTFEPSPMRSARLRRSRGVVTAYWLGVVSREHARIAG